VLPSLYRPATRIRTRGFRCVIRRAVHGTATLYIGIPIGCAVRRAWNRNTGEVCQGAVATPVFGRLRPPNPLCTPIVASRVATARLTITF
jgi:hypothetical protein